jgi:RNA polymerase sigma-70 factor (ECF subfamily)
LTDEELVISVRSGDHQSLGVLVARWERPLYCFAYRMLQRQEDARDICQETFLRVLKKAHRFREGSKFSTWMYQIALNLCRDQLRKRRRWSTILAEDRELNEQTDLPPDVRLAGDDPSLQVEKRQKTRALQLALKEIPSEQREVLIMKEYEGLKFKEIAEILDAPESTVKSRMYYGLTGLKTALSRQGITEA